LAASVFGIVHKYWVEKGFHDEVTTAVSEKTRRFTANFRKSGDLDGVGDDGKISEMVENPVSRLSEDDSRGLRKSQFAGSQRQFSFDDDKSGKKQTRFGGV
jgi:hypothetical protein